MTRLRLLKKECELKVREENQGRLFLPFPEPLYPAPCLDLAT